MPLNKPDNIIVYKLVGLYRDTRYRITECKHVIIIIKLE